MAVARVTKIKELAEMLGVDSHNLSVWLNRGKSEPTKEFMAKAIDYRQRHNINMNEILSPNIIESLRKNQREIGVETGPLNQLCPSSGYRAKGKAEQPQEKKK
jgi:hypothetical protein